jgi:hypothetical protein
MYYKSGEFIFVQIKIVMNKIIYTSISIIFLGACSKPFQHGGSNVDAPSTYSFANANYDMQQKQLAMLDELLEYCETARTSGTTISATSLKNKWMNSGSPFSDPELNSSGISLMGSCSLPDEPLLQTYMDSMQVAATGNPGSMGIPGIVTSTSNPSRKYVLSANGWDYTEMLEKGAMGAVFYDMASAYLGNIASADNATVVAGFGTQMEHEFDQAFGYFGVPANFPANTNDALFWGEYCNNINGVMNTNATLMHAFLNARAAISQKKYAIRDIKVTLIIQTWDKLIAAAALSEINEALNQFSDDAVRNHTLSEFVGFVNCFKYSPSALITTAQINTLLGYIGNNLYNVSSTNLHNAKNMLSSIYGLDAVKDIL